jgi:hypothetical protein
VEIGAFESRQRGIPQALYLGDIPFDFDEVFQAAKKGKGLSSSSEPSLFFAGVKARDCP